MFANAFDWFNSCSNNCCFDCLKLCINGTSITVIALENNLHCLDYMMKSSKLECYSKNAPCNRESQIHLLWKFFKTLYETSLQLTEKENYYLILISRNEMESSLSLQVQINCRLVYVTMRLEKDKCTP